MTLVLALKWIWDKEKNHDAVLMVSDSRVTYGPVTYEAKKIHSVFVNGIPVAIAGGSGDAAIVKYGYHVVDEVAQKYMENGDRGTTLTQEEFRELVGEVEKALIKRFRELREMGIDVSFNMILSSVDPEGRASIYHFDSRGLAEPVHDTPGFAIIGSGSITGGLLLLRLLGYSPSVELNWGLLSTFIVDMVSEIDPSVGPFVGESWLMRVENEKVALGQIKDEALREFKEQVRKRKELIQELMFLCDVLGEEKVEEVLFSSLMEVDEDDRREGDDKGQS
ncbi:hypothetical protein FH039_05295 [Thermococcus indicus]|uniref:Uncharacterized protein n=1 Tax=Thermococcus indicus TaxID=2586643 RepID=A0A4Y5SLS0_9EURY|nr:hypothetical protein [Thermococcus indicus]QDA31129.1 hypothetical protein FH039_05295 [Thermococcus indicus]